MNCDTSQESYSKLFRNECFSLKDLLEDEDLIQELRNSNPKAVSLY